MLRVGGELARMLLLAVVGFWPEAWWRGAAKERGKREKAMENSTMAPGACVGGVPEKEMAEGRELGMELMCGVRHRRSLTEGDGLRRRGGGEVRHGWGI